MLTLLLDIVDYLDAINKLLVSTQSYVMLIFFLLSVVGGVYIGYSIWGRR